jgi:hypothetical protein
LEISEDEFNALANKHGGEVEKKFEELLWFELRFDVVDMLEAPIRLECNKKLMNVFF